MPIAMHVGSAPVQTMSLKGPNKDCVEESVEINKELSPSVFKKMHYDLVFQV